MKHGGEIFLDLRFMLNVIFHAVLFVPGIFLSIFPGVRFMNIDSPPDPGGAGIPRSGAEELQVSVFQEDYYKQPPQERYKTA